LRDREIYCDARGDGGSATAECREPASCDRLPVHRSESPTGYSSAGCSPAEPASASPVTDNSSSIPIRRGSQMRCSTSLQGCSPAFCCDRPVAPGTSAANGVSLLLCAPGDISILRRHPGSRLRGRLWPLGKKGYPELEKRRRIAYCYPRQCIEYRLAKVPEDNRFDEGHKKIRPMRGV
jgi:hypothetical protein